MGMQQGLLVGAWIVGPPVLVVLAFEGAMHLCTNWPKPGDWCQRCRRPMQGDPVTGSICEACEPLGPTRRMRQRAAQAAAQSGSERA